MRYLLQFGPLYVLAIMAALVFSESSSASPGNNVLTDAEFDDWLATTDANLTFIGDTEFRTLVNSEVDRRATTKTRVTMCDKQVGSVCGGTCTIYKGGPACVGAQGVACIAATANVGFCTLSGCNGNCSNLNTCAVPLGDGFCGTPGAASIVVPANYPSRRIHIRATK
ncbi:hypothetical protein C8Q79DRAFT_1012067 [Trametes meyenii]|nr:hypothetical protein C8Q79DRAFT_1012067 [Trametes meyenii]